jgi:MoaA/NifB/PqqE/SkfB family radical SAM enzyme
MTPQLKMVSIEITTRCTAHCAVCPRDGIERKDRDMPVPVVLEVVRQAHALGARTVHPHLFGEPTLHPHYIDILEEIHAEFPDIRIVQYTNGSTLHDIRIRNAVLQHVAALVISVDGATDAVMRTTRPGLDPVLVAEGIEALHYGKEGNGPTVTIRMTRLPVNARTECAYRQRWKPFCDRLSFQNLQGYHGRDPEPKRRGCEPCDRIFTCAVVHVNGNVVLCCDDYDGEVVLGNIQDATLAELWGGEGLTKIRELHLGGYSHVIDMCGQCSYGGVYKCPQPSADTRDVRGEPS